MRDALLVPRAAVPYLDVAVPAHVHRAELAPVRREALDVLAAGWRSAPRTLLGLLAWAGSVLAALLFALLPSLDTPWRVAAAVTGCLLLAGAAWLAVAVLRAGRRITGAAAGWLQVPAVGASGRDAGPLYAVLRRQVALSLTSGAAAIALLATAAMLLPGWVGAASLSGAGATRGIAGDPRLLAVLVVAALATAVVAVGTFGGARRVLQAAWARPTVGPAPPAHPVPSSAHPAHPASPPAPAEEHPPTVAIDLSQGGSWAPGSPALGRPATPPAASAGPTSRASSEVPHPPVLPRHGADGAPTRAPRLAFEAVLGNGTVLRPGTTLVGRSPRPRPGDAVDHVLVLTDQTVTKTHALITVDRDAVRVVDRASTNGTLLETEDGSLSRCRPWEVTTVRAPAMIHLGRTRILVRPLPSHTSLEVA